VRNCRRPKREKECKNGRWDGIRGFGIGYTEVKLAGKVYQKERARMKETTQPGKDELPEKEELCIRH
jgi:hypothetical protein